MRRIRRLRPPSRPPPPPTDTLLPQALSPGLDFGGLPRMRGSIVTARGRERSCPSCPPTPRGDPDASLASCSLHLASPGAAGGLHAATRAPGLALLAMALRPGAGRERRGDRSRGGHGSLGLAARLQVSTRALLCNTQPEEREPRAPGQTGRAHKQSHVASGPGGRAKSRLLFRQQSTAASGRG